MASVPKSLPMNRRLASAKKGPAFWLIRKITFPVYFCVLLYLSVVVYARAPVPNLSGTWTLPDGTIITMVQQGRRMEGRISALSPQALTEAAWHSGDMVLEGVITQGKLIGKAYVHFHTLLRNDCPDEQLVVTGLELRIVNPFSLDGRHLDYVLHSSGCRVVPVGWARMALSRREFDITESPGEIGIILSDTCGRRNQSRPSLAAGGCEDHLLPSGSAWLLASVSLRQVSSIS
jgi:hypothetical protein